MVCGHVPPQTEPFEACGLPNEKVELSQLVSCDLRGFDNRRDRNHKLSGKAPPRGPEMRLLFCERARASSIARKCAAPADPVNRGKLCPLRHKLETAFFLPSFRPGRRATPNNHDL